MLLLAQPADGRKLGGQHGELAFDRGDFLPVLGLGARFLGAPEGLVGLGFVQVGAADRRVGEHGDYPGLYLEDATGDEDELLLAAPGRSNAHGAGPDARDERGVARVDAQLARLARQHDELGLPGEDRLLRTYYIDMDGGVGHYFSVFAFSKASSMAPTM